MKYILVAVMLPLCSVVYMGAVILRMPSAVVVATTAVFALVAISTIICLIREDIAESREIHDPDH